MSEYIQEISERLPCVFTRQPEDLHTRYVVGTNVVALCSQAGDILERGGNLSPELEERVKPKLASLRKGMGSLAASDDPWKRERVAFIDQNYRDIFHTVSVAYDKAQDEAECVPKMETPLPPNLRQDAIEPSVVRWMASAPDRELTTFLDWNARRLQPLQTRLVARAAHMQAFIIGDVEERLVKPGLLPPRVLTAGIFDKAMQASKVIAADAFAEPGAAGFFRLPDQLVGTLDTIVDSDELYRILFHEYTHSIELLVQTLRNLYGDDPNFEATLINEAFVEHLTVVGIHGKPTVVAPHERSNDGVYRDIRELFSVLIPATGTTLEQFSVAYCESQRNKRNSPLIALRETLDVVGSRLFREFRPSFGQVLMQQYNTALSPEDRIAVIDNWICKIAERGGIELPSLDLTEDEIPSAHSDPSFELIPVEAGELNVSDREHIYFFG